MICGESLPPFIRDKPIIDRLRDGHDLLVKITGKDFGYDLAAWHNHLKESRQGGYTYGRNIVLPRIMKKALESPPWREAVDNLTS